MVIFLSYMTFFGAMQLSFDKLENLQKDEGFWNYFVQGIEWGFGNWEVDFEWGFWRWFLFFFTIFTVAIMMLNVLIAIVGETFNEY